MGIPTIFPAVFQMGMHVMGASIVDQRPQLLLAEFPFKRSPWAEVSKPGDSQTFANEYRLSTDELKIWYSVFEKCNPFDPPWHRMWEALGASGVRDSDLPSLSAKRMLEIMATWVYERARLPAPNRHGFPIDNYIGLMSYRSAAIDKAIEMDLFRPRNHSRLLRLLEGWKRHNVDFAMQLRNEALRSLEESSRNHPLFEDFKIRLHDLYAESDMRLRSAFEVGMWLEDVSGPRDGDLNCVAVPASNRLDWCVRWLQDHSRHLTAPGSADRGERFTPWMDSRGLRKLMEQNQMIDATGKGGSDTNLRRYKSLWQASWSPSSSKLFRFSLDVLDRFQIKYPDEWDSQVE